MQGLKGHPVAGECVSGRPSAQPKHSLGHWGQGGFAAGSVQSFAFDQECVSGSPSPNCSPGLTSKRDLGGHPLLPSDLVSPF